MLPVGYDAAMTACALCDRRLKALTEACGASRPPGPPPHAANGGGGWGRGGGAAGRDRARGRGAAGAKTGAHACTLCKVSRVVTCPGAVKHAEWCG